MGKVNVISFKKVSSFILIAASIILFSTISNVNITMLFYIFFIIAGFIKILGFLIIPLSKFVTVSKSYLYLTLYLGGCGIFSLSTIFLLAADIGRTDEEMVLLILVISVMEFIALYVFRKADESTQDNKTIIVNVFCFISISIFSSAAIIVLPQLGSILNFIFKYKVYLYSCILIAFVSIAIKNHYYFANVKSERINNEVFMFILTRILWISVCLIRSDGVISINLKLTIVILSGYYIGKIYFICIIQDPNETLYQNLKYKNRDLSTALEELEEYSNIIKQENEHVKSIINSFPEAVGIYEKGKLISINNKFMEIFDCYIEENLIGREILEFIRPDYKEQFFRRKAQLERENHCEEIEYMLSFQGVEFRGEVVSSRIYRGEKPILVTVIRDITRKKLIEDLNKTIAINERENQLRSELLTNLSHEFKTPVNVIYSAIQMQDVYSTTGDIDSVMKFNHVIKQNCFRLIRLINNFIDISRFEANSEIKSNIKPLNIVTLVEDVVESVISYGNNNKISIVFDTENEEIYGNFDSDMMDRIMLNLLSNAIKYNVDNGSIYVNIGETEKYIVISVKDTGVGIAEENLEMMFQRFERFDKSLSRKREGTGIGLNIVKSLVEYQKGIIDVASEIGVGTTFSLIFPRIEGDSENIIYKDTSKEDLISKVSLELSDII